jgi:protein O-GlcNAc transferase
MHGQERRAGRQHVRELEEAGRPAAALAWVGKLLDADASDVNALLTQGRLLASLSRYAESEATLLKAHAALAADDQHSAQQELGRLYLSWGKLEQSLSAFEKATMLQPNSGEAHYGLGLVLRARGRYAEAKRAFEHALALDGQHTEAKRALSDVELALGR